VIGVVSDVVSGVVSGVVMKAGEIWLAQLDPTIGSEIQKTRPAWWSRPTT